MEIEKQIEASHKRAFRTAFDFLMQHWPVQNTNEWWSRTVDDLSLTAEDTKGNELAWRLLGAILDYLSSDYVKEISKT